MDETETRSQAEEYAMRTATDRCGNVGDGCEKCAVRTCDYRSRRDAYIGGYNAAKGDIIELMTMFNQCHGLSN